MSSVVIFRENELVDASALPIHTAAFVRDSRAFLALSGLELEAIVEALRRPGVFVGYADLMRIVRDATADRPEAKEAGNFIWNLDRLWRTSSEPLEEFVSDARELFLSAKPKENGLTKAEFGQLAELVPRVLGQDVGLSLKWRAERLAGGTGLALEQANIFCDARPIFDEDKEQIEGIVMVATLKIVATGLDGLPAGMEVRLTPHQLHELSKTAQYAEKKLRVLSAMMVDKQVPFTPTKLPGSEEL